jgi:hypothetical protein
MFYVDALDVSIFIIFQLYFLVLGFFVFCLPLANAIIQGRKAATLPELRSIPHGSWSFFQRETTNILKKRRSLWGCVLILPLLIETLLLLNSYAFPNEFSEFVHFFATSLLINCSTILGFTAFCFVLAPWYDKNLLALWYDENPFRHVAPTILLSVLSLVGMILLIFATELILFCALRALEILWPLPEPDSRRILVFMDEIHYFEKLSPLAHSIYEFTVSLIFLVFAWRRARRLGDAWFRFPEDAA